MKRIRFVDKFSSVDKNKPFAIYLYDETLAQNEKYADIRGIAQAHEKSWMDELNISFQALSKVVLSNSRWWWATPMSRLDLRPWGQEYVIKELFFARALKKWIDQNAQAEELYVVGAPAQVAYYLKEFAGTIRVEGFSFLHRILDGAMYIRNVIFAWLRMWQQLWRIAASYIPEKPDRELSRNLVVFELVWTDEPQRGHRYYFGSIFEDPLFKDQLKFACICEQIKDLSKKNSQSFFLLSYLTFSKLLKCLGRYLKLCLTLLKVSLYRLPCQIENSISHRFWNCYLVSEIRRLPIFLNLCVYEAMDQILKQGIVQTLVYPYEEKPSERSILYAAHENNVLTIGYTPHPQHHLALALKDFGIPQSPKPDQYAVCGRAYIPYLNEWGSKLREIIRVWGSGKSCARLPRSFKAERKELKVLVLISHPNELRVFKSWLTAESRLRKNVTYMVRLYKALKNKDQANQLSELKRCYFSIEEGTGSLAENLEVCDMAIFCATSAGIVAAKSGILSIHVCLDDFFAMNPCFDQLQSFLSCSHARELADRFDEYRGMDQSVFNDLLRKQSSFAEDIFAPLQHDVIREDLLERNLRVTAQVH